MKNNLKYWFIRKNNGGEHIRLRIYRNNTDIKKIQNIIKYLDYQFSKKVILGWSELPYEPEALLFGGSIGMELAHDYFCFDSSFYLQLLNTNKKEIKKIIPEISIWMLNYSFKSAGLDSFEVWDTWNKVYQLRYIDMQEIKLVIDNNREGITILLQNSRNDFINRYYPISEILTPHIEKIDYWGQSLAEAFRNGKISRGLRQILSYIAIFHWNRFGFKPGLQSGLACMASTCTEP